MLDIFRDRKEAGIELGRFLADKKIINPFVFGIPRGGVVVGLEVANKLNAPLDTAIVKKLGMPFDPELAFGSIAPEGIIYINQPLLDKFGITENEIRSLENQAGADLDNRIELYRGTEKWPNLEGFTAILVDDGIATGATIRAAIAFVKNRLPDRVIVAAPVCAKDVVEEMKTEADDIFCLKTPVDFMGVGQFYENFPQIKDEEVIAILRRHTNPRENI